MTKRWKMVLGVFAIVLAWTAAVWADVLPPPEWEMALLHNSTGPLVGFVVLVMFGFGTGLILYGVCGMVRKRRRQ